MILSTVCKINNNKQTITNIPQHIIQLRAKPPKLYKCDVVPTLN